MALVFPAICDTPQTRLKFVARVEERWRLWHNTEADRLFPDRPENLRHEAGYWKWWKGTAKPRMDRIHAARRGLQDTVSDGLSRRIDADDGTSPASREVHRLRVLGKPDTTHDALIQLEDLD